MPDQVRHDGAWIQNEVYYDLPHQILNCQYISISVVRIEQLLCLIRIGTRKPESRVDALNLGFYQYEKGEAVDIRLPKTQISSLRKAAYRLKKGGVGYYPKLNFVHVNVGSIRYWRK